MKSPFTVLSATISVSHYLVLTLKTNHNRTFKNHKHHKTWQMTMLLGVLSCWPDGLELSRILSEIM